MEPTDQSLGNASISALERKFAERLRQTSLRPTLNRLEVLSLLSKCSEPVSTQHMFARLTEAGSSMKISACYRAIADLEQHGLLGSERLPGKPVLYWLNTPGIQKPRHRMVCRRCARGFLVDPALSEQLDQVTKAHGLSQSGDAVTILVQCDCAEVPQKAAA